MTDYVVIFDRIERLIQRLICQDLMLNLDVRSVPTSLISPQGTPKPSLHYPVECVHTDFLSQFIEMVDVVVISDCTERVLFIIVIETQDVGDAEFAVLAEGRVDSTGAYERIGVRINSLVNAPDNPLQGAVQFAQRFKVEIKKSRT